MSILRQPSKPTAVSFSDHRRQRRLSRKIAENWDCNPNEVTSYVLENMNGRPPLEFGMGLMNRLYQLSEVTKGQRDIALALVKDQQTLFHKDKKLDLDHVIAAIRLVKRGEGLQAPVRKGNRSGDVGDKDRRNGKQSTALPNSSPSYIPKSPPRSTVYAPQSPVYTPASPTYRPQSPVLRPNRGPNYFDSPFSVPGGRPPQHSKQRIGQMFEIPDEPEGQKYNVTVKGRFSGRFSGRNRRYEHEEISSPTSPPLPQQGISLPVPMPSRQIARTVSLVSNEPDLSALGERVDLDAIARVLEGTQFRWGDDGTLVSEGPKHKAERGRDNSINGQGSQQEDDHASQQESSEALLIQPSPRGSPVPVEPESPDSGVQLAPPPVIAPDNDRLRRQRQRARQRVLISHDLRIFEIKARGRHKLETAGKDGAEGDELEAKTWSLKRKLDELNFESEDEDD